MRKRLIAIFFTVVLSGIFIVAGLQYYNFVSRTIYKESTAHLTEIYHQANQSLHNLVGRNWSSMHLWANYFEDVTDEKRIEDFVAEAKDEVGFTDFYFISRESSYRTIDGKTGYLDLQGNLSDLILNGKDVVVNSVVPGQPQIMVFVVPTDTGTYKGFDYEAIAISFNNSDLVKTLEISAFNGQSATYVIHSDGRVIMDNTVNPQRDVYNFVAMLKKDTTLSSEEIDALQGDFLAGRSGTIVFCSNNIKYYLVYESVDFEDWMVLGVVPTGVVNASINRLQTSTLLLVTGVSAALSVVLAVLLIRRYRRSLSKKDTELLYREELFSILSNNVDDIFIMLDTDTLRVDYISPNIEKLVGITESEVRNNIRVLNRLVKDVNSGMILDWLPGIHAGEQAEIEREYIHQKTGKTCWFHATALCCEIGDKKKYILVLSDRTKDKKINQELEDAVNLARSANRAKSTFLSNMSHDIRTPMNAIIGFATLSIANVENTDKVKDYLFKILSSGKHLLSLINDVLDMSRIESGRISLEEQEANLSDIFHDIKTIISGELHAKQLELCMDIMDVTNEDVICDKTRLNQVLLNLMSNAVKFSYPGGKVSVRVTQLNNAPEGKGLYEIRVKDTGIGMSTEFIEKIFEPFEREHTSTVRHIQGTGLGMAISKNIIDMMGGSIEVKTEQGKGTEFIIRLALRLQAERRRIESIKALEGLKALVVDDDINICYSVTKMLTQVGMKPEWTLSGKEAVSRAKRSMKFNDAFHIYIIDWRLPDINGIEVVRRIRALGDNTPVIIITAYDWTDIEVEAKAAGVTTFCSKPMFMSDLREALLTAIGQQDNKNDSIFPNMQASADFKGKKLLLAEDNELNRDIALEILEEYGFKIDTVKNGAEAVEKIAASVPGEYALVLMDIQMPVMDGYEATRRIRALGNPALSEIPILAMTANAFDKDRQAAMECGMSGFLVKPIDVEELIRMLQNIFKRE